MAEAGAAAGGGERARFRLVGGMAVAQLYASIDGKQYRSADGPLTAARVRLHNASNWLRNHDFHRGALVGLAVGLVVAFMVRLANNSR